jgi:hypothetical protein
MSAKSKVLDRLAELEAAALEAEEVIVGLEQEERDSIERAERARAALREYFSAVGSGSREADPAEEERLASEAEQTARRLVADPSPSEPNKVVDVEIQGKLATARGEAWHRREAVRAHVEENREQVEAALLAESLAAYDAVQAKLAETWDAVRASERAGDQWRSHFDRLSAPATPRYPTMPRSAAQVLSAVQPGGYVAESELMPSAPLDALASVGAVEHLAEHGHKRLAEHFGEKVAQRERGEELLAKREARRAERDRARQQQDRERQRARERRRPVVRNA